MISEPSVLRSYLNSLCPTGVRAGASAPGVVREGLPEEVTFLQTPEGGGGGGGNSLAGGWRLECQKHTKQVGAASQALEPRDAWGVRAGPWHLRGPHFAPRRGAAGRGAVRSGRPGPSRAPRSCGRRRDALALWRRLSGLRGGGAQDTRLLDAPPGGTRVLPSHPATSETLSVPQPAPSLSSRPT